MNDEMERRLRELEGSRRTEDRELEYRRQESVNNRVPVFTIVNNRICTIVNNRLGLPVYIIVNNRICAIVNNSVCTIVNYRVNMYNS